MKCRKRKGFSLIELLVAIVVLGILGAITIAAGSAAQQRARITSAMTVFDDYKSAFNTAVMDHPGLVNDRLDTWTAPDGTGIGATYSSKDAFARLVANMNRALSTELKLTWNDTNKCYESTGEDPWGGKYVLLECPSDATTDDKWDPTTTDNQAAMRMSIWCTGIDPYIVVPESGVVTVRDISVGIVIEDKAGNLNYTTHGAQDGLKPFTDNIIHIQ